jgi:hypothetical protein
MTKISKSVQPERSPPYEPVALYYVDSDCVEYVKEDTFCIYERIDGFLTLIFDETKINLIGFKLKGFKCVFDKFVKPLLELNDMQFVDLVPVLEFAFTQVGNHMFSVGDEERRQAYKAARKLAANDNVRLYGAELKVAA